VAHWNVKGPNFISLHLLFDKINDDVEEHPAGAVDRRSHVEALASALAAFGKSARKAIGEANELGDLDTANLFTEVSRGIDKWLWFVEAHLQAER
jgi:starvation-inducible DNA-binding protein